MLKSSLIVLTAPRIFSIRLTTPGLPLLNLPTILVTSYNYSDFSYFSLCMSRCSYSFLRYLRSSSALSWDFHWLRACSLFFCKAFCRRCISRMLAFSLRSRIRSCCFSVLMRTALLNADPVMSARSIASDWLRFRARPISTMSSSLSALWARCVVEEAYKSYWLRSL